MPAPFICDFCSAPSPARTFACAPFIMSAIGGFEQWSDNAWAACDECAALIDADRWEALMQRTIKTFPEYLGSSEKAAYRAMLKTMHERFRIAKGQVA